MTKPRQPLPAPPTDLADLAFNFSLQVRFRLKQ
jgi:hypothetical protein